jgi:hypothetical protein
VYWGRHTLIEEKPDGGRDFASRPLQATTSSALLGSRSHASTIFARNVRAARNERDRVIAKRCARSSLDIVSVVFGRPVRIG